MKSINLKILAMCLLFILIIVIGKSVFAKYILETSEVLIIETNLDRTAPKLTVSYSTTNMTNGCQHLGLPLFLHQKNKIK